MENDKKEILERLQKLGLIITETAFTNLTLTLNDVVNSLLEDELQVLKEFEELHKRKLNGGNLSYLEESFYKKIAESYTKK
ncbi:hypothetical protein [Kordia sp.]|uniref:hypothetical protein n=1 Tax=Kordia sp. TaxID=1965332 RepID=UPI003D2AD872